ncbi:MAG: DUF2852 domain-containing protein [Hyphomicrobiaceae bacterium]
MSTATLDGWVDTVDQYGKAGWITLMILGFILFWPIGLALLAYLIWSGRMGCSSKTRRAWRGCGHRSRAHGLRGSSGNTAFDEYREETLRRLEDEQNEFSSFLDNLRKAQDKAEFDQFMNERARRPEGPATDNEPLSVPPTA